MDSEFADVWATDPSTTQAAKPRKPFLKRGEGVAKRLNAYKQRPANSAATASTDEVGDASRPTASDQADGTTSSYWAKDVTSQPTSVPRARSGDQGVQQQQQQLAHSGAPAADTYKLGSQGGLGLSSSRPSAAAAAPPHPWDATGAASGPQHEDLELEEFRALERQILKTTSLGGGDTGDVWSETQHQSQQQEQEQERQYQRQQQDEVRQQQHSDWLGTESGGYMGGAVGIDSSRNQPAAAAAAAADQEVLDEFGDGSEWVTAEFSFASLTGGDAGAAAGQQPHAEQGRPQQNHQYQQRQQQQQQQQRQHQAPGSQPQQRQQVAEPAAVDDLDESAVMTQPFVRSLWLGAQQQGAPAAAGYARGMSNSGSPSAAARMGGARGGAGSSSSSSGVRPATAAALQKLAHRRLGGSSMQAAAVAAAVARTSPGRLGTAPAGGRGRPQTSPQRRLQQQEEGMEAVYNGVGGSSSSNGGAPAAAAAATEKERAAVMRLRAEVERAAAQLQHERTAWERHKAEAEAQLEAAREEEGRRLAKERRVLEQQSRALLKLPTKKERAAVEALEALLERERSEGRAASARHKLSLERLRAQLREAQERNLELQQEVRWLEAQALAAAPFAAGGGRRALTSTMGTQTLPQAGLAPLSNSGGSSTMAGYSRSAGGGAGAGASSSSNGAMNHQLYAALFSSPEGEDGAAVTQQQQQQQGGGGYLQQQWEGEASLSELPSAAPANSQQPPHHQQQHRQQHMLPARNGVGAGSVAATAAPTTSNTSSSIRGKSASAAAGEVGPWRTLAGARPGVVSDKRLQQKLAKAAANGGAAVAAPQGPGADRGCPPSNNTAGSGKQGGGVPTVGLWGSSWQREAAHEDVEAAAGMGAGSSDVVAGSSDQAWGADRSRRQPDQHEGYPALYGEASAASAGATADGFTFPIPAASEEDESEAAAATTTTAAPPGAAPGSPADTAAMLRLSLQHHQHLQQQQQGHIVNHAGARTLVATAGAGGVGTGQQQQAPQVVRHPDGKTEELYHDGRRVLRFANGTVKASTPADGTSTIRFANGDFKRQHSSGRVEYYYAEVATWQCSHPGGLEVFYFPSGQREGHHADGVKEIVFPDGSIRRILADGFEVDIPRGQLSAAVALPAPCIS